MLLERGSCGTPDAGWQSFNLFQRPLRIGVTSWHWRVVHTCAASDSQGHSTQQERVAAPTTSQPAAPHTRGHQRLEQLLLMYPAQETQRHAPDVLIGVLQVVAQVLANENLHSKRAWYGEGEMVAQNSPVLPQSITRAPRARMHFAQPVTLDVMPRKGEPCKYIPNAPLLSAHPPPALLTISGSSLP